MSKIDFSKPILVDDDVMSRFWSYVTKTDTCWLWCGYLKNGYGAISINDEMVYTHQLSYAVFTGVIPKGLEVLHRCDVKNCIRPDDLFLGTQLDNIADMRSKGRNVDPPTLFGEDHPKVTHLNSQVEEARRSSSFQS